MATRYEPEWRCRRCKAWTSTKHRHCSYCGRYRWYYHVIAFVAVLLVAAAYLLTQ